MYEPELRGRQLQILALGIEMQVQRASRGYTKSKTEGVERWLSEKDHTLLLL